MAYTPASITTGTSSLNHLATIYYKKKALDNLKKNFMFSEAAIRDSLPKQSGKTVQWFRYLPSAVVPTTIVTKDAYEGSVGTGITVTSSIVTATISQYTDFATVSDMLQDTAIDPIVENVSEMLSYRASYIVDTVTRTEIDSSNTAAITSGTSTSVGMATLGTYFRAADARNARHTMEGLDIHPMTDGMAANTFFGILHPYNSYDLVNDPAAGGLMDIYKFTNPQDFIKTSEPGKGAVAKVGGCTFYENTNVLKQTGSPNKWRVYVFGKGAYGIVDLAGEGPDYVKDPDKSRFKLNVVQNKVGPQDPEGVIGAFVSYNFKFVAKLLDSPNLGGQWRYRMFDVPSSIVG